MRGSDASARKRIGARKAGTASRRRLPAIWNRDIVARSLNGTRLTPWLPPGTIVSQMGMTVP